MLRDIITIDEEKCNGCGLCIDACHEGALQLVDGKAKLISEAYCDGLGNCLPACPTNAITIEKRESAAFDEEAMQKHLDQKAQEQKPTHRHMSGGCPGTRARTMKKEAKPVYEAQNLAKPQSELQQWPVQIKLVPAQAPYLQDARLLIAADCTAYAYANIHEEFIKGRVTLIGCPKLDMGDYADKLTDILTYNNIRSVTVLRMEVPCCGGIVSSAIQALQNSGKMIPWEVVTVTIDGELIKE